MSVVKGKPPRLHTWVGQVAPLLLTIVLTFWALRSRLHVPATIYAPLDYLPLEGLGLLAMLAAAAAGAWFRPKAIMRILGAAVVPLLATGVVMNVRAFPEINDANKYGLQRRNANTLFELTRNSPTDLEREQWGLYFFLASESKGARLVSYSDSVLIPAYIRDVARFENYRFEAYPHELTEEQAARLANLPQRSFTPQPGCSITVVLPAAKDAATAIEYRLMTRAGNHYLVPTTLLGLAEDRP